MARLSDADRVRIWRGLMRYASRQFQEVTVSKADLREAIDATDGWIDDNAASYNTALPVAARNNLSVAQKVLLLCVVSAMRVSPAFVRQLIGGIDE